MGVLNVHLNEERVVTAFCAWLESEGWTVQREVGWADVVAQRDGTTLYAEAKGQTKASGLDIDTAYDQLLRRMADPSPEASFALVVPDSVVGLALRVSADIRRRLRITIYGVDADGRVTSHS